MKKVYVVCQSNIGWEDFESNYADIKGVYLTLEEAKKALQQFYKEELAYYDHHDLTDCECSECNYTIDLPKGFSECEIHEMEIKEA